MCLCLPVSSHMIDKAPFSDKPEPDELLFAVVICQVHFSPENKRKVSSVYEAILFQPSKD